MARLLEPGELIERWLVQSRHSGSWGVVYVVRELNGETDARPETLIAKTMRPELAADPDRMNRFQEECNTWLSLGIYKHIVRLFFVDRFAGQAYAFGEYIPEEGLPNTLRGWLDHNLVELELALRFGLHIINALDFAHRQGLIVHQDLKPENIMITPDGVAKVTDWGLSRMAPREVRAPPALGATPYRYRGDEGSVAWGQGTRVYAAPELAQEDYTPTQQADLFSLGVMMAEMLTGQRPSAGIGARDLSPTLQPLGPQHQIRIAELLAWCLSAHPDNRPRSTAELRNALAEAFEELVGVPAEPAPTEGPSRLSDIGQRAYALMMLGRIDEGLQLHADLMRRIKPEEEKSGKTPVVVMDYKEHGFKLVMPEEHLAAAENELRADPANPERIAYAIMNNRTAGRLDHALELCQAWLDLAPEDPAALRQCADVLAELGRRQEALDHLDRAIAREPSADLWIARAKILNEQGDPAEALHSYERAVELDPDNVPALNEQGHLLATMGDHARAAEAFREATNHDPKSATAWYNLGTSLNALKSPQEARDALLRAVEADPEFYQALNTLGVMARLEGNDQEALVFFRRAIAANSEYAKPWLNMGNIYEIADQPDKAREAYQRALDIDPGYTLARVGLDRLAEQGW